MSLGFCPGCFFHQESHSSPGHFSMDKVVLSPTGLLWIASLSSSPLTATPAELCMWLSWHRPPNLVPRQTWSCEDIAGPLLGLCLATESLQLLG
ncbi:mCG128427 [Mus musculus]|nr:mCG128427 [Mus musculus]